eukprot:Hpha_TRINITY_DN15429_c5_g1::TRINITY_DN15429_c5_g1_i1::g.173399::m.173399
MMVTPLFAYSTPSNAQRLALVPPPVVMISGMQGGAFSQSSLEAPVVAVVAPPHVQDGAPPLAEDVALPPLVQDADEPVTMARIAPPLEDDYKHKYAEETDEGAARTANVVIIRYVSVDVCVKSIRREIDAYWPDVHAVKLLPVWNKGIALAELSKPVKFVTWPLRLGNTPFLIEPSDKTNVKAHSRSSTLNARFFYLDPRQDYDGTPEENVAHARFREQWELNKDVPRHGKRMTDYLELAMNLPDHSWTYMGVPLYPNSTTQQLHVWNRRKYTQLFFTFRSCAAAERVIAEYDGMQKQIGKLRIIFRFHSIDPASIRSAPRLPYPNTGNPTDPQSPQSQYR